MNKIKNVGFKFDYIFSIWTESVYNIKFDDIKTEVDYWSTVLVCYVLGINFISAVFSGFI